MVADAHPVPPHGFGEAFVAGVLDAALAHEARTFGISGLQGTGKSTLAAQLVEAAGLPKRLDDYVPMPGEDREPGKVRTTQKPKKDTGDTKDNTQNPYYAFRYGMNRFDGSGVFYNFYNLLPWC